MAEPYEGDSTLMPKVPGIKGTNSVGGVGVWGESSGSPEILPHGNNPPERPPAVPTAGVWGESKNGEGVHGVSHSPVAGVAGYNDSAQGGPGVRGEASHNGGEGVHGVSHTGFAGVGGYNDSAQGGPGVWGTSQHGEGVHGETHSLTLAAVAGISLNPAGTGAGVYGESKGQGAAGFFKGNVVVTGDAEVTGTLNVKVDITMPAADFAEDFPVDANDDVEPGTVMVLGENGLLRPSDRSYDKKVAGVISGAGDYQPGIILDRQRCSRKRLPLALVGKVYCKVDAAYSPIDVGDLLTTSPTAGRAMKAADPMRAFGAVIGKALRPWASGHGLIPILISLQ